MHLNDTDLFDLYFLSHSNVMFNMGVRIMPANWRYIWHEYEWEER